MSRKTLLVSAGGAANAWHLANLAASRFQDHYRLLVCDIHARHLVASATLAEAFHQVPPSGAPGYREAMLRLFEQEGVDVFVPLIDPDLYGFPADDPDLARLGVVSPSVDRETGAKLRDKGAAGEWLRQLGLPAPRGFTAAEIAEPGAPEAYFVKPRLGFGSRGVYPADRTLALEASRQAHLLVQERCTGPEVTVEVFNDGGLVEALCRERLETKDGVCTKARLWVDAELTALAERLCAAVRLPVAFCFQVMRDPRGAWVITDLNPRLGAGTAMSTQAGWSLAAAALIRWGALPLEPRAHLGLPAGERFVVRVYTEIVTA